MSKNLADLKKIPGDWPFYEMHFFNKETGKWSLGKLKFYLACTFVLKGRELTQRRKKIICGLCGIKKSQFWRNVSALKEMGFLIEIKTKRPFIPTYEKGCSKKRRVCWKNRYVIRPESWIQVYINPGFFKYKDWFHILAQMINDYNSKLPERLQTFSVYYNAPRGGRDLYQRYKNKTKFGIKIPKVKFRDNDGLWHSKDFFHTKIITTNKHKFLVHKGKKYRKLYGAWVEKTKEPARFKISKEVKGRAIPKVNEKPMSSVAYERMKKTPDWKASFERFKDFRKSLKAGKKPNISNT